MSRCELEMYNKRMRRLIDIGSLFNKKAINGIRQFDSIMSTFKNETELKYYLYSNNLITKEEFNNNFRLLHFNNKKETKKILPVMYGEDLDCFLTVGDKTYIDVIKAKYKLFQRGRDINFLSKLFDHYNSGSGRKYNKEGAGFPGILDYLRHYRNNTITDDTLEFLDDSLSKLFDYVVFKYGSADYYALRDLGYLISEYNKEIKKSKELEKENNIKYTEGEQLDMFDINEEVSQVESVSAWTHDEPDFAPNEEIGIKYQEYIDNLDVEFYSHDKTR